MSMTGAISGGYIFADVIKNFLNSIIFVFFVRPFEVKDFILVEGKLYKVKDINILTSTLTSHKLNVVIPNAKMLTIPITNYRTSKAIEKFYEYTFNISDFKDKQNLLLDEVIW